MPKRLIVISTLALAACSSSAGKTDTSPDHSGQVTETNVVERTPQSCKDALNEAEQVFHVVASFSGTVADMLDAAKSGIEGASIGDSSATDEATSRISADTSQIDGYTQQIQDISPAYKADAAACRAG